jgi:GntR family transcriptional regulator/MocR family aminotransferase
MRVLYAARRAALLEAIGRHLPGKLEVVGAEAGMQLAVLLPEGVDDLALSRSAAQAGVSVRPLSQCYRGPVRGSGLILGYGGVDERAIEEGIRRLARCL